MIFEGPLDLLLHLIKNSEINIYDIQIAEITRQYLEYLALLVELDLDNISEFVETAATLILIKSKTMLPIDVEYEESGEDPRAELIQKLLEYEKYKIAAGLLEMREEENIPIIKREVTPKLFKDDEEETDNWKQLSIIDLLGAFARLLNESEQDEEEFEVLLVDYTVEDKITTITELLDNRDHFNYFEIIKKAMPKVELVCIFLALLELVKKGRIGVRQHKIFGDIEIVKKPWEPAVEE
jgi:segregation and condensation protein A